MVKWVKKGIRCDNFAFITDPRAAPMIKSVTDQMNPKGTTETHAERNERHRQEELRAHQEELRQRRLEEHHRAHRHLKIVKTSQRNRLTLAVHRTLDWLEKNEKPRR